MGAYVNGGARGENSHNHLPHKGDNVHDTRNIVTVRYDGAYSDMDGDNICFTFLDHFMGTNGRDYFKTSWTGVRNLLRTGINLDDVRLVVPDTRETYRDRK